ncbi:hypothetical protein F5Y03DRAFT_399441 [Xylaria venustula]|nr:hypothetical protein F5Y03DRAFT_399441 [Xylaria venustula]
MSSAHAHLPTSPANNPNITQAPLDGHGLATAAGASHQRPPSASYFSHPTQDTGVEDQTLSNTLANAHIMSGPTDGLQIPNRQPKFNEEWDASVRGDSIVDDPSTTQHPLSHQQQQRQRSQSPNVQRPGSISSRSEINPGDSASTHGISLSRGNTLKKKNSLRRSTSLKRSGSRRSMKAGSAHPPNFWLKDSKV